MFTDVSIPQVSTTRRLTLADVEAAFRLAALRVARKTGTYLGDDDLEEIAQMSWLSYWATRRTIFEVGEDPVRVWVYAYRVGKTQTYRYLHARWDAEEWDEAWDDDDDDAPFVPIAREPYRLPSAVVHGLFHLLVRDRAKRGQRGMRAAFVETQIICATVAGYDDAYIARIAGLTVGSVKTYRRRIRARLRRLAALAGEVT